MIVLNIIVLSLLVLNVSTEDILKSQFPVYGLTEIAAKQPLRLKTRCITQLKSIYNAVKKRETWALRMLDASGSPTNGFIWGNNYWLGTYSQCRWISKKKPMLSLSTPLEFPPFGVDYYISLFKQNATLQAELNKSPENVIHLGLCLPSACSSGELELLLSAWAKSSPLAVQGLYNFSLDFQKIRVVQPNFSWLNNPLTIILAVILSICILLTLVGTVYDIYVWTPISIRRAFENKCKNAKTGDVIKIRNIQEFSGLLTQDNNLNDCYELKIDNSEHKSMPVHVTKATVTADVQQPKQGFLGKVSLCFSAASNSKIIFNSVPTSEELSVVYGLRFIGMIWLIWLYSVFYLKYYSDNKPLLQSLSEGSSEHLVSYSTFSVDTFFFASGFILAFKYYKDRWEPLKSNKNFSIKKKVNEFSMSALKKFLRLTPTYVILLCMVMISTKSIKENSLFEIKEPMDEICEKYWWRNIFYINNLFKNDEMCMSWSWYLSTNMQFFLFGVFILILSTRFWKFTFSMSVILMVASSVITGYLSYGNRYTPTIQPQLVLLHVLHYSPWTRIGPYLIGMFTGYFIVHLKGELIIKRTTLITCWLVGSLCNFWALFGLYSKNMSVLSTALYTALSRTAWGFGLSWIVIACCTGNAGVIKGVLSYHGWSPFSKLSYPAYLFSPFIINLIVSNSETPIHLDFFQMVVYFFGHLSITYLSAFLLSLFFEIPLVTIGRKIMGQKQALNQLNRQS